MAVNTGWLLGPKGELATAELIAHSDQFARRTYQAADGVHTVVGYGLANATVIEGSTGLIVVDTGDSIRMAKGQFEQIRKISNKPVRAVSYSHNHYALEVPINNAGTYALAF